MANPEHLAILKQGVEQWNEWRKGHLDVTPDLRKADLVGANLIGASLYQADLAAAKLGETDLWKTDLNGGRLRAGDFSFYGASRGLGPRPGTMISIVRRARLSAT